MNDQAQALRDLVNNENRRLPGTTKVLTVTSGKGGVGKSNFSLNFALALKNQGNKVLVFDADIGMANIDVLMGVSPAFNLYHLLKRQKTIWEIIQQTPYGIEFIAGGSGFNDLVNLTEDELDYFYRQVEQLNGHVDYIIFDTGAGLSKETLKFILSAQETVLVTTPEPTAITDAYALIKMVHHMGHREQFRLVINQSTDEREGKQTADKIRLVSHQFLNLDIPLLGFVEDDPHVSKAVKRQTPFLVAYPNCPASRNVQALAAIYDLQRANGDDLASPSGGIKQFLSKMKLFRFMNK